MRERRSVIVERMQQVVDDSAESNRTAGTDWNVSIHYRPEANGNAGRH